MATPLQAADVALPNGDATRAMEDAPDQRLQRREWLSLIAAGFMVTVAFWPSWELVPRFGGGASWHLGLAWAADLGLQWGSDVAFTYGPLGFMSNAMVFSRPHVLAASGVYVAASLATVTSAYYLSRERLALSPTMALVSASIASGLSIYLLNAEFAALVMGSMVLLVSRSWLVLGLVGLGLGIIGQQKLSEAVLVLGFAALCTLGAMGWRGLLGLAATTGLTWLGVWVATGQAVGNIPAWIADAVDLSLGYAEALGTEWPAGLWNFPVAILLSMFLIAVAWFAAASLGRWRRSGLMMGTLWALWLAWNAAFDRHDESHARLFFIMVIILALALLLAGDRGRSLKMGLLTLLIAYVSLIAIRGPFLGPLERGHSLASLGRTVAALTSDDVRTKMLADAASELIERYQIDSELQAFLGTAPTLADPEAISAIWAASGPEWRPLPPLQLTTSYTDRLDRKSEESLLDEPRQILRSVPYLGIDGRYPPWNSPRFQTLVYCRYSVAFITPTWQVLRPTGANRCADPQERLVVKAAAGEQVPVPYQPGMMTFVTIEPQQSLLQAARSIIFKPESIYVDYGPGRWRYANGEIATRLMLNAPLPHPAFPTQPLSPYRTISLDRAATLTFESSAVEVPPIAAAADGRSDISDVVIRAASSLTTPISAPELLFSNDVAVDANAGRCVTAKPTGIDPYVAFMVPAGSALRVVSESTGSTQVFLEVDGEYSEEQSTRFVVTREAYEVFVPALSGRDRRAIRIDPPDQGATNVCAIWTDRP